MMTSSKCTNLAVIIAFLWNSSGGLFIWDSMAWAAEEGSVPVAAVIGFRSGSGTFEAQARSYFIKKMESSSRVRLAPEPITAKVVGSHDSEPRNEANAQVEKALKNYLEGKRLYEQLALEEAIVALSGAVGAYREGIGAIRDNRFILSSHLYLAMALITLGRETEGRKYLREMILLDAARKKRILSQREFSPKIISLHKTITDEVANGPLGELLIDTRPGGANVYLDGVLQKASPVQIPEVPQGEHFIVVEKKGYRQFLRRITVGTGVNKINISLEEWQPLAPYAFHLRRDQSVLEQLSNLASTIGAQILVLGKMAPSQKKGESNLSAQMYDTRSKEFTKIEKIGMSTGKIKKASEELVEKLLTNLTTSGFVVAEISQPPDLPPDIIADRPGPKEGDFKKPLYKQWWFWTIVGGVVAGGTGGFLLTQKGKTSFNVLDIQNPLNQ